MSTKDSNILKLAPTSKCNTPADIVAQLREVADVIEKGAYGAVANILLIMDPEDAPLDYMMVGKNCDKARVLGLMTMIQMRILTA